MDRRTQILYGTTCEKQAAPQSQESDDAKEVPVTPIKHGAGSLRGNKAQTNMKAKEAIGTFGFGILLGWILLCYFSTAFFSSDQVGSAAEAGIMRFIGLGIFGTTFAVFLWRSDFLATVDPRKFLICALVGGLALPLCMLLSEIGFHVPVEVVYAAWGLNGLSTACAFLMAANYYSGLPRDIIVTAIAIACLVASCWYVIVMFLPFVMKAIAIYLSLPLSVGCLMIFVGESTPHEFVSRKDSETIIGLNVRTSISLTVVGIASGYLLYKIISEQPFEMVFIIGAAFLVNALFSFIAGRVAGQYSLLLAPMIRYGYPVAVAGFIILPFASGAALVICEIVLLATLIEHWISSFINISFAIQKYKIQAFYLWTRVNVVMIIGCALGWGVGFFVYEFVRASAIDGFSAALAVSLVFAVVFALAITITPYGIDHLTVRRNFETKGGDTSDSNSKKAWWDACHVVALQAHLTPRETEVFLLLAKGRNSKIIERELSISTHTVKSHNYNIYRKVGVESQQELIDAIEKYRSELKRHV